MFLCQERIPAMQYAYARKEYPTKSQKLTHMSKPTESFFDMSILKWVVYCLQTVSETVSWLSHDCLMTVSWLQRWIFLRDLPDYLIDNLEKFGQSSPGNKVWSVKHLLIYLDRLSTIVLRNNHELLKNNNKNNNN